MDHYTAEQIKSMSLNDAATAITDAVYAATLLCERLENSGKVRGNGYHMAEKIADYAANLLRERWVE